MTRPRVIIADDHRLVAEGLQYLLATTFDVVAVVEDGRALLEAARALAPDIVVADINMPLVNGIEATRLLARERPQTKVVILTMHRELAYARRALEAGAMGYVLKVEAAAELVRAIQAVLAGRTFVTSELATALAGRRDRGAVTSEDPAAGLTPRQREILQLLAAGRTAKEIAAVLGISARTVESHKYELMQATGLQRSAELVQLAIRLGLVDERSLP